MYYHNSNPIIYSNQTWCDDNSDNKESDYFHKKTSHYLDGECATWRNALDFIESKNITDDHTAHKFPYW